MALVFWELSRRCQDLYQVSIRAVVCYQLWISANVITLYRCIDYMDIRQISYHKITFQVILVL